MRMVQTSRQPPHNAYSRMYFSFFAGFKVLYLSERKKHYFQRLTGCFWSKICADTVNFTLSWPGKNLIGSDRLKHYYTLWRGKILITLSATNFMKPSKWPNFWFDGSIQTFYLTRAGAGQVSRAELLPCSCINIEGILFYFWVGDLAEWWVQWQLRNMVPYNFSAMIKKMFSYDKNPYMTTA